MLHSAYLVLLPPVLTACTVAQLVLRRSQEEGSTQSNIIYLNYGSLTHSMYPGHSIACNAQLYV